jgi:hypothetical protein
MFKDHFVPCNKMTSSRVGRSEFRTYQRREFLLISKTYRKRPNAASYPQIKSVFLWVKETVVEFDRSPTFSDFMAYTGIILIQSLFSPILIL